LYKATSKLTKKEELHDEADKEPGPGTYAELNVSHPKNTVSG